MATTPSTAEQTEVRTDWQLSIDVDAVLRGQGVEPGRARSRHPHLLALADRALAEGRQHLHPQVVYRILNILRISKALVVLENGAEFRGFGIARGLAGSSAVIAAVATLGAGLEQEISRFKEVDSAFALALDGLGTAAISSLTTAARHFWTQLIAGGPHSTTAPLYPGMRGWNLAAAQTELFSLLDAQSVGVRLDSSFLVMPSKSVSLIIGVNSKEFSANFFVPR